MDVEVWEGDGRVGGEHGAVEGVGVCGEVFDEGGDGPGEVVAEAETLGCGGLIGGGGCLC